MIEWIKYLICFIIGIIIFKMTGNGFAISSGANDDAEHNAINKCKKIVINCLNSNSEPDPKNQFCKGLSGIKKPTEINNHAESHCDSHKLNFNKINIKSMNRDNPSKSDCENLIKDCRADVDEDAFTVGGQKSKNIEYKCVLRENNLVGMSKDKIKQYGTHCNDRITGVNAPRRGEEQDKCESGLPVGPKGSLCKIKKVPKKF